MGVYSVIGLILSAALAFIPASIAKSKGRSFWLWWFYGWMLFLVALIHAVSLSEDQAALEERAISSGERRKCPQCAESIKNDAVVCHFCGYDMAPLLAQEAEARAEKRRVLAAQSREREELRARTLEQRRAERDAWNVSHPRLGWVPVRNPSEAPAAAARRWIRDVVVKESEGDPSPYDEHATAGEPQAFIKGYYPSPLPVPWVVEDGLHVPSGRLFGAMQPSVRTTDAYLVPILQDGRPVSEFDMSFEEGRWEVGAQLAEPKPAGFFFDVERAQSALHAELGASAQTRVALFLPSGLVLVVGHAGAREMAVYVGFFNQGPGLTGYDKNLPQGGTIYGPEALRGLLTPGGPSPQPSNP
jgi:hypothetical protein